MNRYKKLFSTTVILGIGTFGSKLLTFLLMPLYTHVLTQGEYGTVDLLVQAANLLIPLVSLGINESIMRFGADGENDPRTVFTTGFVTIMLGFGAFCCLFPALRLINGFAEYLPLIYLFILCSMLHYLCARLTKAMGNVRRFALGGVLGTALTLLFDVLFLVVLDFGITGYILAIILSDVCTTIYLVFASKLYRLLRFGFIRKSTWGAMLRYALPLIPTTVLWWITDVSDRYIIKWFLGADANGLYAVSYKIPTILVLLCSIFMDAWQLSVLGEKSAVERKNFFTKVFSMYYALMFTAAGGLVAFAKVITKILVSDAFYESWKYIPTLLIATAFSCLVTFLGTVYVVEKRSTSTLWTSCLGGGLNIVGNLLLIPIWGVQGAAVSTAVSYVAVFVIRALHTRRFIPIAWNVPHFLLNFGIVTAQAVVMLLECKGWIWIEAVLLIVLLAVNGRALLQSAQQMLVKKGHAHD